MICYKIRRNILTHIFINIPKRIPFLRFLMGQKVKGAT